MKAFLAEYVMESPDAGEALKYLEELTTGPFARKAEAEKANGQLFSEPAEQDLSDLVEAFREGREQEAQIEFAEIDPFLRQRIML